VSYKVITLESDGGNYPPEFLKCLRQLQEDGWQMVCLTWSGDDPVLLFSRTA